MHKALDGKDGAAFSEADKAEKAAIAKECAGGDDKFRCDVVSLYDGGVYNLYKYRRFQDVRLVMAPEQSIAFFGGDPDNFEFPRYDLDVSYMRVYVDGRPFDSDGNYFPYAKVDVASRRPDVHFRPSRRDRPPDDGRRAGRAARPAASRASSSGLSEFRGILTEFATKGVEEARISRGALFGVENSLKALKGRFAALVDPAIIKARAASEADLRAKVDADPEMKAQYGDAWDEHQRHARRASATGGTATTISRADRRSASSLFGHAKALVRRAAEVQKPDEQRLEEYTEANFPMIRQSLISPAPIYPELERLELTFSLTKMREVLGPDDPFVRKVLGRKSPAQLAAELVDGSDAGRRGRRATQLLDGGQTAIDASTDPMIVFVRGLDGDMRALRKDYEDKVKAPLTKYSSQISKARFKIYGDVGLSGRHLYAADFLWLGRRAIARTARTSSRSPRSAARSSARPGPIRSPCPRAGWRRRRSLNKEQPFNFVTTNDIIGGNSGSPVINKAGEVVGLIFDGNIQSLGGDFGYDGEVNRAVAVNVGALREALIKVYHADRLVEELAK